MTSPVAVRFITGLVVITVGGIGTIETVAAVVDGRTVPIAAVVFAVVFAVPSVYGAGWYFTRQASTAGARARLRRRAQIRGSDVDGDGRLRVTGDIAALFASNYATYVLRDTVGQVLYVGKATNGAHSRLRRHLGEKWWGDAIASIEMHHHGTQRAMDQHERDLIRTLDPLHNHVRYRTAPRARRTAPS